MRTKLHFHLRTLAFLMLSVFYATQTIAQETMITGTVTTTEGEPIPFANILVKGSSQGTAADMDGSYAIQAKPNEILVFSYVGFKTIEVSVEDQTRINIQLEEDIAALDEVVVIGYQSVSKKDLTGAMGLIDTKDTENIVKRSVPEALQGLSPGINVRNGGAPGQNAVVNIRGLSTFYGNASPLYIIDGMFADPNITINPNDVESIQVLKDASAAAIYGARAAN